MNKLEVGMYVRYKTLSNQIKIAKIIEIDDKKILDLDNKDCTNEKYIIGEPSFDIIDVVRVKDYVNGEKIIGLDLGTTGKTIRLFTSENDIGIRDIKSVLTHEQFEQMEYKIGDDK